jgi:hypothetical protein
MPFTLRTRLQSVVSLFCSLCATAGHGQFDEPATNEPSYRELLRAFEARGDAKALEVGEKLLKLGTAEKHQRSYIENMVADLKRRENLGRFGKPVPKRLPKDFPAWDEKRRVAWLIDSLDEVNVIQTSQPGHVNLAEDFRVKELIRIGDAAVPDLIETLDNDPRLTRSEHYWRFWVPGNILSVREAALTALESILRLKLFETHATGENFTQHGEKAAKDIAKKLRDYWKEHGQLSFTERMMKVLTNPKADYQMQRDAAFNISHLSDDLEFGWRHLDEFAKNREKPNPAVEKFSKPTAAEAILAVMDAELSHLGKDSNDNSDYGRIEVEDHYLQALIALGDSRIAGELGRRAGKAASQRMRRNWAFAAHQLGEPLAFQEFAKDVLAGTIPLPKDKPEHNPQANVRELGGIVHFLILAGTTEANEALMALAEPKHAYHSIARLRILEGSDWYDRDVWFEHPFCLALLRRELDNRKPTGWQFAIVGGEVHQEKAGSSATREIPELLADAAIRNEVASQQYCDAAAEKLNELVWGLPRSHVLFKNQEERIDAMKLVLGRFGHRYRKLTWPESSALGVHGLDRPFVPDIKPLDHAATAEDLEQGKAVFELGGGGKLATQGLPAIGELKSDDKSKEPVFALIVQAEVDSAGEPVYGAILPHGIRRLCSAELASMKTLAEIEKEREEYLNKLRSEQPVEDEE